ncbi:MAG: leucyl/phenylalanyl-tRNA--protein transferase [Desulfobulbaceae bacterium DB1]|nr:MAG: leucyl/phenylalanyl-tRNA--protein transferase [Desulfobulbaceae bacterium DB1]
MIFGLTDDLIFPPPYLAREDGLLAIGGDLSVERLLLAYSQGIFPWYGEEDPILWWAPDPRLILEPGSFHLSRRLARVIRQGIFSVSFDAAFEQVIDACSSPRPGKEQGTWLVPEMKEAYVLLHEKGYAHSVECWRDKELVGGLYGVSLGRIFFGESMFSRESNSSKVALAYLVKLLQGWQFDLIDCQMKTGHLISLGAREITGHEFYARLQQHVHLPAHQGFWSDFLLKFHP